MTTHASPSASAGPCHKGACGCAAADSTRPSAGLLNASDSFVHRHIGPDEGDIQAMLELLGFRSLDQFSDAVVPASIRLARPLRLDGATEGRGEFELLQELKSIAGMNKIARSFIGMGYHDCITPPVILRNILENPGWYTQYTPYQAEISQGRLEALLNFQTMVSDLTGLPLAGASLLDEATAAAEAMAMCFSIAGAGGAKRAFFVAQDCHPQTIAVCRTRAESMGIELRVGDPRKIDFARGDYCGALFQYPTTDGRIEDYAGEIESAHRAGALAVVAADLLALTLFTPPGEFGADIAVGSAQRFGVPMGAGGPHAAYIATKHEYARKLPGRIIGVSKDAQGRIAYRMAIQTREQHIRREKATSNICTAQALLAIVAGMYAVYHGPEGLRRIALRVRSYALLAAENLRSAGNEVLTPLFFDAIRVRPGRLDSWSVIARGHELGINLRDFGDGTVGIACDETTTRDDLARVLAAFGDSRPATAIAASFDEQARSLDPGDCARLSRHSGYLTHPVFNSYHSETEMLRYIFRLQGRDLSLAHSMIPLGSCTMKLNATSEMIPVTWPEFGRIHPYAPADQLAGYHRIFRDLEKWLAAITGFSAVSLQPNAGSQGEYAGLLAIRAYHKSRGQSHRNVCLIPDSAHGTNPASAVIAGFKVVAVSCDEQGNVNIDDLRAKAEEHRHDLAALMVTYPSTHGVFEEGIREICRIVHEHGGQVYMDGANMNAQVGLTSPGEIGADVCHLNLHKTFCIPHGGGGPGMGPIAVAPHLAAFLPGNPAPAPKSPAAEMGGCGAGCGCRGSKAKEPSVGAVSAAPYGSPSILTISWVYIALMGAEGLKRATQVAMLNANYMARRLKDHYDVLFTGANGLVAHEFIIDCRSFEQSAGVKVEDIAKRLMDYGFHAPTMSFPVPGTLMIEPTESENRGELDRLCDALIAIREEVKRIERGEWKRDDNPLKHAPHPIAAVTADEWNHAYTRREAAFPKGAPWLAERKFWPPVARIDNAYGDRNLVCACPPMSAYAS